jgi:CheY-like chemotaxis protein
MNSQRLNAKTVWVFSRLEEPHKTADYNAWQWTAEESFNGVSQLFTGGGMHAGGPARVRNGPKRAVAVRQGPRLRKERFDCWHSIGVLVNSIGQPWGDVMTDQEKPTDRVLIVEDEENARRGYEALLRKWGLDVLGVSSAEEALARFSDYRPAVLIADVELPGMDGLTLLGRLGEDLRDVPAIVITGKGNEERAVAAIEAGAFWYIEKPLKGAVLRALLDRALGRARDRQQVAALTRQLREAGRIGEMVGGAKPMQEVMRLVEQVSPSSASVLITGETGSGK